MTDPTNDTKNYNKWGIYYNPDDIRIIVPKRIKSLGFTLNFARKETYLILAVLLLILFTLLR